MPISVIAHDYYENVAHGRKRIWIIYDDNDEEKAKCDGLHNGNDEIFVYYDIDEEKDKMWPLLSVLMMMMMMMVMVMRRKTRYDNCYIDDDDYQWPWW